MQLLECIVIMGGLAWWPDSSLPDNDNYRICRQIACFKVKKKTYNFPTRTAEHSRAKTAQNSQRSCASNEVPVTKSSAASGWKSFCGLEAFSLATGTVYSQRVSLFYGKLLLTD
jgi:hypothetical protein